MNQTQVSVVTPRTSESSRAIEDGQNPNVRLRPVSRPPWKSLTRRHDAPLAGAMEAWGRTDRGRVRLANEDCFLVSTLDRTADAIAGAPPGLLLMVADGVGGRPGGEVASVIAVDAMACYVQTVVPWVLSAGQDDAPRLDAWLHEALQRTQARIRRFALRRGLDTRLATTFTMACLTGPDLVVAHVGDSRCYLVRGGKPQRLTVDHTLAQHLFEQGQLVAEARDCSPYSHLLINSLGGSSDELNVDIHRTRLEPGDELLLCTDGLTRHLSDEDIGEQLSQPGSVGSTVDRLVGMANDRGGSDNLTVVLARP